ncbi:5-oxoprolinase subunit B family protein [Actinomycetota bacterium]
MEAALLPAGESAVLVEVAGLDAVLALAAALQRQTGSPWEQVTDIVPAARTVLLLTEEGADLSALRYAVEQLACDTSPVPLPADAEHTVEIPVRYDGPDLADVARLTGLTIGEVVEAHTGRPWRVGFGGFAPGFAYLVDGDPRLRVPRHEGPRPSVPAGSVALAGEFSGIYPRSSPGGWRLIGTTDVSLWDLDRTPPALLQPGSWVHFTAVTR